jgi:hypothetical protein
MRGAYFRRLFSRLDADHLAAEILRGDLIADARGLIAQTEGSAHTAWLAEPRTKATFSDATIISFAIASEFLESYFEPRFGRT